MPWADMLNHKPGCAAFIDLDDDSVNLTTDRAYNKGEQVWASYGQRPSSELLISYGFAPEVGENPDDEYALTLGIDVNDPYAEAKAQVLRDMGLSPGGDVPASIERLSASVVAVCVLHPMQPGGKAERASKLGENGVHRQFKLWANHLRHCARDGQRARARYARGDLRRCGGRDSRSGNACGYVRRGAQRVSEHARKRIRASPRVACPNSREPASVDRRCAGEDSRYAAFGLRRTSSYLRETYSRQDGQRSPSAVAQIEAKVVDGRLVVMGPSVAQRLELLDRAFLSNFSSQKGPRVVNRFLANPYYTPGTNYRRLEQSNCSRRRVSQMRETFTLPGIGTSIPSQ